MLCTVEAILGNTLIAGGILCLLFILQHTHSKMRCTSQPSHIGTQNIPKGEAICEPPAPPTSHMFFFFLNLFLIPTYDQQLETKPQWSNSHLFLKLFVPGSSFTSHHLTVLEPLKLTDPQRTQKSRYSNCKIPGLGTALM